MSENNRALISVHRDTWTRLNRLKIDPSETFDDVVRKLLDEKEGKA